MASSYHVYKKKKKNRNTILVKISTRKYNFYFYHLLLLFDCDPVLFVNEFLFFFLFLLSFYDMCGQTPFFCFFLDPQNFYTMEKPQKTKTNKRKQTKKSTEKKNKLLHYKTNNLNKNKRVKRRSSRVYKQEILNNEQGNKQLELWLKFLFGNPVHSNQSINEDEFVYFLPNVLTKIIFEYSADFWDPYSFLNEIKDTNSKEEKMKTNFVFDVCSSFHEENKLLGMVPIYFNQNKFILIVIAKEKRQGEGELAQVRFPYQIQIQRWDLETSHKYDEKIIDCFNNKMYVTLKIDLLKKHFILFSSGYIYNEGIIYIYDLKTFMGRELKIESVYSIAGIYQHYLIYGHYTQTYQIQMINVTTSIRKQKMTLIPKLYIPYKIQLFNYHPNFILLFYYTRINCASQRRIEIWNHCIESRQPILIFEKCDQIWEFFSFPSDSIDNIILGKYYYDEKKDRAHIEIWKINSKNQEVAIIQTHFLSDGKKYGGRFLQISIKYFICWSRYSIFIYEMKSFSQIQKLFFYPKQILDVFYSPIGDHKLWIIFQNGEVKIF